MNFEILQIERDLAERQEIINRYSQTGSLDREKVIEMIRRKRFEDSKIAAATAVAIQKDGCVPFEYAKDENLIKELQLQIDAMLIELQEKRLDSI